MRYALTLVAGILIGVFGFVWWLGGWPGVLMLMCILASCKF